MSSPTVRRDPQTRDFLIVLAILVALFIVAVLTWFAYHAWWVDTHCTMVLGTQVCQ